MIDSPMLPRQFPVHQLPRSEAIHIEKRVEEEIFGEGLSAGSVGAEETTLGAKKLVFLDPLAAPGKVFISFFPE